VSVLHILVCAKQVLDPEGVNSYALWGRLNVDETGRGFETGGAIPYIINAYDEQAIEAALRLRDDGVDCTITVAVIGGNDATTILRRALAMGVDRVIDVSSDEAGTDGFHTAAVIAGLVRQLGDIDLVICGRQGSDFDQGTVPAVLAERLDWSYVTMAAAVSYNRALRITRVTPHGNELVEAALPAVVAVSNEVGQPRYPSSRLMLAARRVAPEALNAADLAPAPGVGVELVELIVPEIQGHCVMIAGDSPEEQAIAVLGRLTETGVLDG
jgi:electron transfer flavoprotein beta subunit